QATLNLGYQSEIIIVTPLMKKTKAETFAFAEELGFLDTVVNKTHTCYNGDHTTKHDWGYGCDNCPACELRKNGWNEFIELSREGGEAN
ncbi:MAG: 7-cyano-7-deazaguanine synthase, partial [Desulfobacteraceae bacterium]|nr:7-cyano-7-deazaguanine synthase [Desulfobacteraceae bacterium]